MKTAIRSVLMIFALSCVAADSPKAHAVVPPPDGGYPNFNTAEGQNALFSLTTGAANTAVGWFSLHGNTDGSFNTAVGAGTLISPTGASRNTAIGTAALLNDTTGSLNTAVGTLALFSNNVGSENTAVGDSALFGNTSGTFNTANGQAALFSNTIGSSNTAVGSAALLNNIDGVSNTAVGGNALRVNAAGNNNTAIGTNALLDNTGSGNIALGADAGSFLTTGNNNIDIGNNGIIGESETIRIGGSQTKTFIAGIRGVTISTTLPVLIDPLGQLGTMSSSRRFKKEIKPMENASEVIHALKPVTFHYKSDNTDTPQFGLIAEEVAEANPDLVVRDENGQIYTVRYEAVNAMLLNEFLKEHRTVQEQGATIAQLKKEISSLTSAVKEQAAQIQKVSALVGAPKARAQVASRN